MDEVVFYLGSEIKKLSGFNIVATHLFEGFSERKFSFTITLIINTLLTKTIKK